MSRFHVLVDLGNTDLFRGLVRPNPPLIADRLEQLLDRITAAIAPHAAARFVEVRFRLYHGWFTRDGRSTEMYAMVSAYLGRAYPTRRRAARLFAEVAETPAPQLVGERLIHTFRQESGLPAAALEWRDGCPSGCVDPGGCTAAVLRSWLRGRCPQHEPRCAVELKDLVSHRRQKLVDTALVADLVWLASRGEHVAVVSDDEDVLPGLLTAASFPVSVLWLCRNGQPRVEYSHLVARARIGCVPC